MNSNSKFSGKFARTGLAAAILCLTVPAAWSLGLGRLQVQSALGESLRAEIDVTSLSAEEASNLRVRVATPESYRAAGVDYNPVLPGTQAELLRRADGRPYVRLTSDRSVQEPFVDVILEVTWATGRLVREYTLLFDPPITARTPLPAPATAAAPAPGSAGTTTAPSIGAAPPATSSAARNERRAARAAAAAAPAAPLRDETPKAAAASGPTGADEYRVKAGDSLSRIASRTARAGVSLDQMLVSLYRGNPQAFIDNNMNRLKAGVVLAVPAADAAKAITPSDARQVIQAQSADFGAYRQRLASGVPNARAEGSTRVASGKVTAKVEDRQTGSGTAPDKLTLSKGATPAKSAGEDKIAKDRAKQADDLRVAELKKNVEDLKKLSGATATAASASKPATTTVASKPAAPAPAPAPAVAAASVPAPATVAAPRPPVASAPVVAAAPAPAPAPVASAVVATAPASASAALGAASVASVASAPAPVVAAASAPAPRPAASAPVVAAKPNATPSDDSGGLGTLIEDNATAFGVGAALIALLGGWGLYRFLQRKKKDSGETSFLESRLQPDSFFGASGGQRIDTRDAGGASSSMSYSLSQLDAIGDVDPVAEADVYLAYGRDLQAEEILKEAMRSNPDRMAIRTKLLEVYAKRRDTKGFELLATQLFALTKGEGEDWAKAQELGAQMDPDNPLFRPGGAPVMAQGEGGQMIEPLGASTMPQSVLPSPSRFASSQSIAPMPMPAPGANDRLDLDLDLGDPSRTDPATAPAASAASLQATQAIAPPATASRDDDLALDFSLPDVPELQAKSSPHLSEPSTFDLSEISLDLDMPQAKPASALDRASGFGDIDLPSPDDDPNADPLARKLELAEEFRQIGDMDGARDLLHEVVARSSGALKSRAQSMLADLG